ncbi:prephenate dehydrogenase/arogenate dehydrogenase family protein [Candidatus Peregrinibacteria bacterium]|nr:prephenate dehydrogenase/arogenate dehydrogenase family protein [Candidatus Peregrinibacteria bacterium]
MENKPKIGIMGLGTFGKCLYRWLSEEYHVEAFTRSLRGATCQTMEELVSKVDIIFLCVPIGKFEEILKQIIPLLRPGQMIVDVCSVKVKPVEWMVKNLPDNIKILATHPMFGPQSAAESLEGLNFMYSRIRCEENDIVWLLDFLNKYKLNIAEMTPEEHDRIAARTQALSFFVGHLLKRGGLPKTSIDTTQYRMLANFSDQICEDTEELFEDLLKYNPYAKDVISEFVENANQLFNERF